MGLGRRGRSAEGVGFGWTGLCRHARSAGHADRRPGSQVPEQLPAVQVLRVELL